MGERAIVFDLDGTLYDTKEIDEANKTAAKLAVADALSISIAAASDLLIQQKNKGYKSTASMLNDLAIPDSLIKKHQLAQIFPEGILIRDEELVRSVRAKKPEFLIILLTNTRREIALRCLHALGFEENDFDVIAAGGDIAEPKPSVSALREVLEKTGARAQESFTVGDRWAVDHQPGEVLGMHSVMVRGRDDVVSWLSWIR